MAVEYAYALPRSDDRAGQATVHTQLTCSSIREPEQWVVARIEDGMGIWRHYRWTVKWCRSCPPEMDWSWKDRGACFEMWPAVDMLSMDHGTSPQPLIEQFCDHCPVVMECGLTALADIDNTIGIWGGVHLPAASGRRAIKIAELEAKCAILRSSEHAA